MEGAEKPKKGRSLKVAQAIKMRDVEFELTIKDELGAVVPSEFLERARKAVSDGIARARSSWQNETIDQVFGKKRADTIRSRINRTNLG